MLTKPFPCPSHCIFCPNDPEMPKSYIKSEPGAMRARLNQFDPFELIVLKFIEAKGTLDDLASLIEDADNGN